MNIVVHFWCMKCNKFGSDIHHQSDEKYINREAKGANLMLNFKTKIRRNSRPLQYSPHKTSATRGVCVPPFL